MHDSGTTSLSRIYHPSDFTEASLVAFAHALKLSLLSGAHLHIHHVFSPYEKISWSEYPGLRDFLIKWGILPPNCHKSDVMKLGLKVQKVLSEHKHPLKATAAFVENHAPDLIVLASHQHHGIFNWLKKEVAIPLSRKSHCKSLFIHSDHGGFVSPESGELSIKKILIPIDTSPSPMASIEAADMLVKALSLSDVQIQTLYIGDSSHAPSVKFPSDPHPATWGRTVENGNPRFKIMNVIDNLNPDLVIMATKGNLGFLDAFRGSTTEYIIHNANCPVLAVPQ